MSQNKLFILFIIAFNLISNTNSQCYEIYTNSFGEDTENDVLDIQQNSNLESGTWNVITNPILEFSVFDALTVDHTTYFGFPDLTFNGLIFTVDTAFSDSQRVAVEYWNADSSQWTEIPTMSFLGSTPFYSYGESFFEREQCERMLLGPTPGWDTKTLNGITDYWIRFRILSTLSGNVQLEQVHRTYNQFEIDTGGHTHHTQGIVDLMQLSLMSTASTGTTYLGDFPVYGLTFVKNVGSGTETTASVSIKVPGQIDTSKPVKLNLEYTTTSTGNVYWVVSNLNSNVGTITSSSVMSAPTTEYSTSVAVSSTANEETRVSILLPIDWMNFRPASGYGDLLHLGLKRYSLAENDTCSSSAILYSASLSYIKLESGVHVSLF